MCSFNKIFALGGVQSVAAGGFARLQGTLPESLVSWQLQATPMYELKLISIRVDEVYQQVRKPLHEFLRSKDYQNFKERVGLALPVGTEVCLDVQSTDNRPTLVCASLFGFNIKI